MHFNKVSLPLHLMIKLCKIPKLYIFDEIIYELTFSVSRQILSCINFVPKGKNLKSNVGDFSVKLVIFVAEKAFVVPTAKIHSNFTFREFKEDMQKRLTYDLHINDMNLVGKTLHVQNGTVKLVIS